MTAQRGDRRDGASRELVKLPSHIPPILPVLFLKVDCGKQLRTWEYKSTVTILKSQQLFRQSRTPKHSGTADLSSTSVRLKASGCGTSLATACSNRGTSGAHKRPCKDLSTFIHRNILTYGALSFICSPYVHDMSHARAVARIKARDDDQLAGPNCSPAPIRRQPAAPQNWVMLPCRLPTTQKRLLATSARQSAGVAPCPTPRRGSKKKSAAGRRTAGIWRRKSLSFAHK
jgi:hypothetical protein